MCSSAAQGRGLYAGRPDEQKLVNVKALARLVDEHDRYQRAVRRIFGLLSSRRWWNGNVWAAREIAKDVLLGGDVVDD